VKIIEQSRTALVFSAGAIGEFIQGLGISTDTTDVQTLERALHINSAAGLTVISAAQHP
jgi:hypothetical protein